MQITERTFSSDDYRYGFNGMEKDDELKGEGNSYDFGARMYDPRVGRWFVPDKKFFKQPSWSTYKAFYDSPMIYSDPDGNTEWKVTKVVDHKNNKTYMVFEIVDEDKLHEKVIYTDYYYKKYYTEFRDIIHSNTLTIYEDGTMKVDNEKTEYAKRYTRSKGFEWMPEMPSIHLEGDGDVKVKNGYIFTSEFGKSGIARQNKTNTRNGKEIDMTALEAVTSIIRGGKLPKGIDAVASALDNTSAVLQQYLDANGIAGKINMKEGKIEIEYEEENMINVEYKTIEPGYWILQKPYGNVIPNSKNRDTLVPESKAANVKTKLDKKYAEEREKAVEKGQKIQKGG